MQCLVMGASGYVGSRLVSRLLDVGYEVRCLARDPARLDAAPFHGQVKVVEGDVVSGAGLDAAVEGGRRLLSGALAVAARLPLADQTAAELVVQAAADAGASRVVYLGGLRPRREDVPSRRLASRAEVRGRFPARGGARRRTAGQNDHRFGGRPASRWCVISPTGRL